MSTLFVSLPYIASTNNYDKYFPYPMDYLKLKKEGDELIDGNLQAYYQTKDEIYRISDRLIKSINETDHDNVFVIAGNYAPDADKGEFFEYILERITKDIQISGPYTLNETKLKEISKLTGNKMTPVPYVDTYGVEIPDEMIDAYPGDKKRVTMRISVGCARSCSYCPVVPIHNKRYKFHDIEPVMEQIKNYYERGVRLVVFIDDNMSLHKKNEEFLKKVNKYYTSFKVIEKAMENINKYKLDISVYFLIGLDETEEVVMDNIRFISKYRLGVRVNILRPYENGLLDFGSFERKMEMKRMKHLSSLAYGVSWLGTNHDIDMFEDNALEQVLNKCKLTMTQDGDIITFTGKVYIGFKTSKLIKVLTYLLEQKYGEVKRIKDDKEEIVFEVIKPAEDISDLFG
jgi:sulfur relay (sulfurtransferase) DsrC/TusE family protein